MAARDITPTERAVLDGRQKALKLCSNALYGFTGAQASPMQALPLADSCLAMGAASCRKAVELVNGAFDNGKVRSHSCGGETWHLKEWSGLGTGREPSFACLESMAAAAVFSNSVLASLVQFFLP
jgi:hypothetical protein